jgi:quinolinate synthase
MKLITLEKVLWALEEMHNEITLPREIIAKAKKCIQRMLLYRV